MEFNQCVSQRRSVFKFNRREINLQDIMPLLEAARFAPNHYLTQPWQFLWLGKSTRLSLAKIYARARALKKCGSDDPDYAHHFEKAQQRFMDIPGIVMVACAVDDDLIRAEEDFAACCCAVQNLLLAATDCGIGSQWSTHPMIRDEAVFTTLGLDSQKQRLVAMIYLGWPEILPPAPPRKAVTEFLVVLP